MDRILKRPNQDIISSLAHSCLVGRVVELIYLRNVINDCQVLCEMRLLNFRQIVICGKGCVNQISGIVLFYNLITSLTGSQRFIDLQFMIETGRCQAALMPKFDVNKNIDKIHRALHAIRKLPNVCCNVNMNIYLISEDDNCRENYQFCVLKSHEILIPKDLVHKREPVQ